MRRADGPERVFGEWWRRDAELIAGHTNMTGFADGVGAGADAGVPTRAVVVAAGAVVLAIVVVLVVAVVVVAVGVVKARSKPLVQLFLTKH